jgi:RNA polymerase sigma-70 factor (ECF subfamily)
MQSQETTLVIRAAAGDRPAFDTLAQRCRPWLYGLCLRLVHDGTAAEDLVQEALVGAFRDLPQLRDPAAFRPWLSRIAVNVCRMHLRKLLGRPTELHPGSDSEATARQDEAPLHLGQALVQLSRRERRLVGLFYVEGLSHAELAEALSLSSGAVKSRLHRLRAKLRREMLKMMSDHERASLGASDAEPWTLKTVLLVEPEEELRGALLAALKAAGYDVLMLPTGEAALEAIERGEGQFLLLDKHCVEPHWTEALALVQLAAHSGKNVPVGVFVDPESKRDVFLAWQCAADFCLTRPPQAAEVVEMVKRVAEARSQQDDDK